MLRRATNMFRSHKSARIISMFLMAAFLMSSFVFVSAKNYSPTGGCKAINCLGYKTYYDTTNSREVIEVFFDKQLSGFDPDMIAVQKVSNGAVLTISADTNGPDDGWTPCHSSTDYTPVGASVNVYATGSLTIDFSTEYLVTISSCFLSNNSTHINLGDYSNHNDISFYVFTPTNSSNNAYDSNHTGSQIKYSYLPYNPSGTYVGEADNAEVVTDIPICVDLSTIYLQKKVSGVWTTMGQDTDYTHQYPYSGDTSFAAEHNITNTCYFLPMTIAKSNTAWYNFDYGADYRLCFPTSLGSSGYYEFYTGDVTPVSVGGSTPIVTGTGQNSVTLQWTDTWGDDQESTDFSGITPSYYRVHYTIDDSNTVIDEKYFGFNENVAEGVAAYNGNGAATTFTVTGLATGHTYYFRYVAVYNNYTNDGIMPTEGGFSLSAEAAI